MEHEPPRQSRAYTIALIAILLLASFLNLFRLGREGYGNLYYAAAVKSMLTSWHNFFFVSFDPAGFVSVDKPPLGLWVQAASAAFWGFGGLSLLLPQALAGILAVWLTYRLAQRSFGPAAGLLAALVLTLTPISVATNRNNTMDSLLVLVLLLAAGAALRAAETGRLRWLLLCALLVGLGFNVKMLQAFMVLPAFYLLYLLAPPLRWWKRLLHLALATLLLLAVSLAWVVAVDLTPPDQRPYVGSSQNNSVLELIIGHNGMARLLPGGLRGLTPVQPPPYQPPAAPPGKAPLPGLPGGGQMPPLQPPGGMPGQQLPPGQPPGGSPGRPPVQPPGGMPGQQPPYAQPPGRPFQQETGEPGLLRLFNQQLAGQASWLLPLAGLGLLTAAWQERLRFPLGRRHAALLLWAAWLTPMLAFFSVANLFHRYYLAMLSPAIAALVGAGVTAMWADARRPGWRGWLLPLALLSTAAVEAAILADFPDWSRWLTPLVVGLSLLAAAVLLLARLLRRAVRPLTALAAAVGMAALLIAPAAWACTPVFYGGDAALPYAGPDLQANLRRGELPDVERLVAFLQSQRQGETYLAATLNANTAAPLILATGEPVMAMGGFSGGDPILTTDELKELISDGAVRFFLVPPAGNRLTRWVVERCATVPPQSWRPAPAGPGGPGFGQEVQLFDCGGRRR